MASIDITAPMAGSVKEILVTVGEAVTEGQEVLLLESMKMEIPVESTASGTVSAILVEPPQTIEEGQALIRLEA